VVKLLQVSAVTNGRREVSVWDAWLLQHCLWNEPGQRERIFAWYGERVGTTRGMDPARLVKLVVSMEARLERDRTEKAQARNAAGKLLYESPKGGTVTSSHGLIHQLRKGEGLFLAPPGTASLDHYNRATPLPERTNKGKGYTRAELEQFHVQDANGRYAEFASWSGAAKYFEAQDNWLTVEGAYAPKIEAMRHKAMYVEHSLKEVASLQRDIEAYQAGLQQHITDLEAHLRAHLWVTSDFVEPAGASLRSTQAQVEKLMTRVEKLKAGFDALPRETKEKDE